MARTKKRDSVKSAKSRDRLYDWRDDLNKIFQERYIELKSMSKRKDKTAYFNAVERYRKDYEKKFKVASGRLKRGLKSDFAQDALFQDALKDGFKPLSKIKQGNLKTLMYESRKLDMFLMGGSLIKERRELRREALHKFHDQGYTFVNMKNFSNVTSFLKAYYDAVGNRLYDSNKALEFYETNAKTYNKMTPKDVYNAFKKYLETGEES